MATLDGFRDSTNRRVVVLFQPHLYSRTRDFSKDFGRAFFSCDKLFIAPIYPARELPIPGVTSQLIVDEASNSGHKNVTYIENEDEIVEKILESLEDGDIFITMGAGRVYEFGEKVIARLSEE
jgi:UDP-N-acetylmuramate--alanine ligase